MLAPVPNFPVPMSIHFGLTPYFFSQVVVIKTPTVRELSIHTKAALKSLAIMDAQSALIVNYENVFY